MILTALLLPVLLIFGAIALGGSAAYVANQDLQRGGDLGALAGAAGAPTVSLDGGAFSAPFYREGLTLFGSALSGGPCPEVPPTTVPTLPTTTTTDPSAPTTTTEPPEPTTTTLPEVPEVPEIALGPVRLIAAQTTDTTLVPPLPTTTTTEPAEPATTTTLLPEVTLPATTTTTEPAEPATTTTLLPEVTLPATTTTTGPSEPTTTTTLLPEVTAPPTTYPSTTVPSTMPTVPVTTSTTIVPMEDDGCSGLDPTPLLDPDDWAEAPCYWALEQFDGDRSTLVRSFGVDGVPDLDNCTVEWTWENPVMAALAECVDPVALLDCGDVLEDQLRRVLPALDDLSPSVVGEARSLLSQIDPGAAKALLDDEMAQELFPACLLEGPITGTCLQPNPMGATPADVAAFLQDTLGDAGVTITPPDAPDAGAIRVAAQLARLAPALTTPQVTVTLHDYRMRPPLLPLDWLDGALTMRSSATARRTFKSAVVMPTLGITVPDAPDPSFCGSFGTTLSGPLGLSVDVGTELCNELVTDTGMEYVLDPNEVTRTTHEELNKSFDLLDGIEQSIDDVYNEALYDSVCGSIPRDPPPPPVPDPNPECPPFETLPPPPDDVAAPEALFDPFMEDLYDLTRPPPDGTEPSLNEILANAATTGDPILFVGALQAVPFRLLVGEPIWTVLSTTVPGIREVMFVPAFDVVPAVVDRPVPNGPYVIRPLASATHDALATIGLYGARLVK